MVGERSTSFARQLSELEAACRAVDASFRAGLLAVDAATAAALEDEAAAEAVEAARASLNAAYYRPAWYVPPTDAAVDGDAASAAAAEFPFVALAAARGAAAAAVDRRAELAHTGCYLDDGSDGDSDGVGGAWRVEAILARRVKFTRPPFGAPAATGGVAGDAALPPATRLAAGVAPDDDDVAPRRVGVAVWYKVKWKGRNLVTWERDESIDDRAAVAAFETWRAARAHAPPTAPSRFRPPVYVSRRLRRGGALTASAAAEQQRLLAAVGGSGAALPPAAAAPRASGPPGQWSCEIEPRVWLPYDDDANAAIERAWRGGAASATVRVETWTFTVDFGTMSQRGGANRSVQRVVIPAGAAGTGMTAAQERAMLDAMTLPQLRDYIGRVPTLTPLHYEMLSRLHQEDKVVCHASAAELKTLVSLTFTDVLVGIAEGGSYPGFSDECHICLEDYAPDAALASLPRCGHFFHDGCIRDYFARFSKFCPICKEALGGAAP